MYTICTKYIKDMFMSFARDFRWIVWQIHVHFVSKIGLKSQKGFPFFFPSRNRTKKCLSSKPLRQNTYTSRWVHVIDFKHMTNSNDFYSQLTMAISRLLSKMQTFSNTAHEKKRTFLTKISGSICRVDQPD